MKLSQLLANHIEAMEVIAETFRHDPSVEGPFRVAEAANMASTLRAIAPALVVALVFVARPHSPPRGVDFCDCAGCALLDALKAAGVSCE